PDAYLPVRFYQSLLQLRHTGFMYEHTPRRGAALTGRPDRAEYDRRHRKIQVRELVYDDRVVAAEFQQALAHAHGNPFADLASYRRRTCKRKQVDTGIVHKLLRETVVAVIE